MDVGTLEDIDMDAWHIELAANKNIMNLLPKSADKKLQIKKLNKILMIINAIQLV